MRLTASKSQKTCQDSLALTSLTSHYTITDYKQFGLKIPYAHFNILQKFLFKTKVKNVEIFSLT